MLSRKGDVEMFIRWTCLSVLFCLWRIKGQMILLSTADCCAPCSVHVLGIHFLAWLGEKSLPFLPDTGLEAVTPFVLEKYFRDVCLVDLDHCDVSF